MSSRMTPERVRDCAEKVKKVVEAQEKIEDARDWYVDPRVRLLRQSLLSTGRTSHWDDGSA